MEDPKELSYDLIGAILPFLNSTDAGSFSFNFKRHEV